MRKVVIIVECDFCNVVFEEDEVYNFVFTASQFGKPEAAQEIDLCEDCSRDLFQNARMAPKEKIVIKKNRPGRPASQVELDFGGYGCRSCDSSFETDRGRRAHQTRAGH